MHEYSGACVCFQCHEKRRVYEVIALRSRVRELESEESLAFKVAADETRRLHAENARLVATLENSQRHYEYEMAQLRKVVDAARKVVGLVSADNCVALAKALRELDGDVTETVKT